ncbi:MAG TPA: DUF1214 domain-containing protein [Rhizomicrobium sp.]|jgi:hypothetical protein|nr:DUF1214 domain-containing protein [Rhizomicrobium sp.]
MRVILKLFATAAAGIALGLFATWFILMRGAPMGGEVADGPWRTSLATGSAASGPVLRARVALHGLFALNRSETIYYTAATDSAGNALDGRCGWRLVGRDPPARWWSITAYGADDFLIPNKANAYSVSKTGIARGADGSFAVTLGRGTSGVDAIALAPGRFTLTLRLYNPAPGVAADPAHVALPRIEMGACA